MSKITFKLLLICILIGNYSLSASAATINPLDKISSYNIYYGYVNKTVLQNMKKYQLMVVEPKGISQSNIMELKKNNTKLYAYISIAEIPSWDRRINVPQNDYLKVYGKIVKNYGNIVGDIRNTSYQNILLSQIKNLMNRGFDGVFFDTLDDYESLDLVKTNSNVASLERAAVQFIANAKVKYPNLNIIQNRGFNILFLGSQKYVKGILYEDYDYASNDSNSKRILNQLKNAKQSYGVNCFVQYAKNSTQNKSTAIKNHWKYLYRNTNYNIWN